MAGTAVRGRLSWQTATVGPVADETPKVRTLQLEVAGWPGHRFYFSADEVEVLR